MQDFRILNTKTLDDAADPGGNPPNLQMFFEVADFFNFDLRPKNIFSFSVNSVSSVANMNNEERQ